MTIRTFSEKGNTSFPSFHKLTLEEGVNLLCQRMWRQHWLSCRPPSHGLWGTILGRSPELLPFVDELFESFSVFACVFDPNGLVRHCFLVWNRHVLSAALSLWLRLPENSPVLHILILLLQLQLLLFRSTLLGATGPDISPCSWAESGVACVFEEQQKALQFQSPAITDVIFFSAEPLAVLRLWANLNMETLRLWASPISAPWAIRQCRRTGLTGTDWNFAFWNLCFRAHSWF